MSWLRIQVTDSSSGLNETNETRNSYSDHRLILNRKIAVIVFYELGITELMPYKFNRDELSRLTKFMSVLIETEPQQSS